ncbi:unnamed protein product [Acanthoscelides obtectus]|nr:unnamed protein product [Acanthoscelides obtectus]CAK1635228.1 hypothetical protein AOBTE_LOCUS9144 [Acanthoscelides obtectus]
MVGIDSISRLNFIRTMPSTYKYIASSGWMPLLGYNKMDENTFPNLMAILTGFNSSTSDEVCRPEIVGKLDTCPMLWYNYSKHGYITAFAEDEPNINTFNYAKAGFKNPPTDYYFRPYILATHTLTKYYIDYLTYCTGPETAAERIMNVAKDFSVTFKTYPYLGLFWMNSFSHENVNSPGRMDTRVQEFLEALMKKGVTEDSIIIFFSDHGMRFGKIRLYNTGWLEERLPFIYFSFPTWFKKKYPELMDNFKNNTNRLTSPYDLHMTLQHVLLLQGKISELQPSTGCPTCRSLFREIPYNRSCAEAGIGTHFCTCHGYVPIKLPQHTILQAAKLIIDEIHKRLKDIPVCLPYTFRRIRKTAISQSDLHGNETYLLVLIETIPEALFETTLVANGDISQGNFSLAGGYISRIDSTNSNDWCTDKLKSLCYCRRKSRFLESLPSWLMFLSNPFSNS